MSRNVKYFIGLLCFISCLFIIIYYISNFKKTHEVIFAPVSINVEIDKKYINNIALITEPQRNTRTLIPTTKNNNILNNIILHTELNNEMVNEIKILISHEEQDTVLASINSITIFIGNDINYYSNSDIKNWSDKSKNNNSEYTIPVKKNKISMFNDSLNWNGDLNYILKGIISLLIQPQNNIILYILFSFSLLFLKNEILVIFNKRKILVEIILLLILLLFSFLLRINEASIKSAWVDELYSATVASNPKNSILNVFFDPGNPPLYYFFLRIWFILTNWSETSGHILSIILGVCSIATLYYFVRNISEKMIAFISAFLLTISYTSIGYSIEMRTYILLMLLVPINAYYFIIIIKDFSIKGFVLYSILGALLVNSHYYGILFIAGNFIFYLLISFKFRKKDIYFIISNILIAISFMPYFFITVYNYALGNENFNSWIAKPSVKEFYFGIFLTIMYCFLLLIFNKTKIKYLVNKKIYLLLNYSAFLFLFIYFCAIAISIYRPIFIWRYMSICFPFLVVIISIFIYILYIVLQNIKFKNIIINYIIILVYLIVISFSSNYIYKLETFGGKYSDIFKVSQQYITHDASQQSSSKQLNSWWWNDEYSKFYNLIPLQLYNINKDMYYDNVIYMNSFSTLSKDIEEREILRNIISLENVLIIQYGNNSIYKIIEKNIIINNIKNITIPKDINEFITYDIQPLYYNDDDYSLILFTGNQDPQIIFTIDEPIIKPTSTAFIEIEFSNEISGIMQIFYDFGQGFNEENSIKTYLDKTQQRNNYYFPIIGWGVDKILYSFRIDPPDDTKFEIYNIKINEKVSNIVY